MITIDGMVYLDEIDEYVTIQEYKEYLNYINYETKQKTT